MASVSRVVTIVTAMAFFGLAMRAVAMQPPSTTPRTVIVVGCIGQAVNDGSLGGSPGVPPSAPATAGTLANSAQPTGIYLLNGATPPDASADLREKAALGRPTREGSVTYELEGQQAELQRHAGRLVEVTGVLTVSSRGTTALTSSQVNHLKVARLRSLASKCPRPSPIEK